VIDTLDPKALAEVIGPDTIQTPPANNARSTARGSAAQSVTLRRGLGGVGDASENANAQGGGQPAQQRGKFAGADVAQKLQSILQGLERKGFGPGGGGEGGVERAMLLLAITLPNEVSSSSFTHRLKRSSIDSAALPLLATQLRTMQSRPLSVQTTLT